MPAPLPFDTLDYARKLELGGRIDRLQWMFGVLVALNGATLIPLFLKH